MSVCLHVRNSGEIPLDVTIALPDDLPYDTHMPAIHHLRKVVHRIRSLIINAPFFEAWQKIVSDIGEGQPAPLLEQLVLKVKFDLIDFASNDPFTTFSTALTPSPRLTHLQFPAWPLPAQPPPQLSTVTSLAFISPFSELDMDALILLIQAAPRLQHFAFSSIDMAGLSDPAYPGSNVIPVPNLRSASTTVPGFGFDLVSNFNAPLLADLCLDGYRDFVPASEWDKDDWGETLAADEYSIMAHFSACTPNIRRLELRYIHFDHPTINWSRLLSGQTLPVLEELALEMVNIPNIALISSASEHSNLRKLKLSRCKYISLEGLRSFVQGRANPGFLLTVKSCPAISQEEVQSLAEFVHVEPK